MCAERYAGLRAKRTLLIESTLAVRALLHFSEATKPLSTYLQR